MAFGEEKYVRFQDWRSEYSVGSEKIVSEGRHNVFDSLKDKTVGAFSFLGNSSHSETLNKSAPEERKSRTRVLDPQGPFLQRWNKIFVISCLIAVSVDPLFFYIPVINGANNCLYLDKNLEIIASVLRFFTDIFYLVHIIFQFRTGFVAPSSRVFGRGALVEDTSAIAKRYLSTYFLIDFLAVLPLPQVEREVKILGSTLGMHELLNRRLHAPCHGGTLMLIRRLEPREFSPLGVIRYGSYVGAFRN